MLFWIFFFPWTIFLISSGISILTELFVQAAKILANLIVMGGGILARAFVQAYRQALASKVFKIYSVYDYALICHLCNQSTC